MEWRAPWTTQSRRRVLAGIASSTIAARAKAQSGSRVPRIAVLSWYSEADAPRVQALTEELARLGWVDGRTIAIELHWADGNRARAEAVAADLVRRNVDIIVARATPAVIAAKRATTGIPILMAPSADPLATGLVDNLRRPGGNITGMSTMSTELAAKRIEVLRDLMPGISRIGFLGAGFDPNGEVFARLTEEAASALDIACQRVMVGGAAEFDAAFAAFAGRNTQAVIAQPIFVEQRQRLVDLARHHRIALVGDQVDFAVAGALFSFGANVPASMRRVARYVDRILKGAKPGDLPVEQPTEFDLAINLSAARLLGIEVGSELAARATEVIE